MHDMYIFSKISYSIIWLFPALFYQSLPVCIIQNKISMSSVYHKILINLCHFYIAHQFYLDTVCLRKFIIACTEKRNVGVSSIDRYEPSSRCIREEIIFCFSQ